MGGINIKAVPIPEDFYAPIVEKKTPRSEPKRAAKE